MNLCSILTNNKKTQRKTNVGKTKR